MGIDLPRHLGTRRLPYSRLRRIIENLPEDSATARARRGQRPSLDTQFLRRIEYWTHLGAWLQTKDAKNGDNKPVQVPLTGDNVKNPKRDRMYVDELLARRQAKRQRELESLKGRDTK